MATKDEVENRINLSLKYILEFGIGRLIGATPAGVDALFKRTREWFKTGDQAAWESWVDQWVKKGFCDKDTGDMLKQITVEEGFWGPLVSLLMYIEVITTVYKSGIEILKFDRQYDLMSKTTPHPW